MIAIICLLSLGGIGAKQPVEASERDTLFTDNKSEKLNREQAAVMLARALQLNLEEEDDPNFKDVNKSSKSYPSIASVVSAGIFNGYSDGTFKPDQSLTRAEMAKILVVAYQLPEEELVVNPFEDVSSTSWYAPYLAALIHNKITVGTSLTTYSPNNVVNRGEMALLVYRCQQFAQQRTERIIEAEVKTITSDSVQLGNESLALTEDLKTWITPENLPILKNARIKAQIVGGTISRIESVTLYASNVGLTGNGAVIDATVIIKGDNTSIKDVTLTGDLRIESGVQNSIYLENVRVKGSMRLSKPQDIVLSETYIKFTGETTVSEIELLADATIEADARITLPIVRVGDESLNNVFNARIDSLFIEVMKSRITLKIDARIEDLRLEQKDHVKFIFLDYAWIKHKIIKINGVPNLDLQPSASGSPSSGENSNLIAAKSAVASLFSDHTKTALKVGVDQAAIDAAYAKVNLVEEGTEKSALVAELQFAQQLFTAQLEAITKLQAASAAVNGLFTDSTKTALKAGVDQAAIDAANAKVDLVADGAEKSALKNAIQIAQDLLRQILVAPTLTGTAPNVDTVRFTFSDDAAWRNKITGVYLNGNSAPIHSSRVNRSNAGMIEINLTGASLRPGTHEFLVKAEGYADAMVSLAVAAPLAAPTLTGVTPNVDTVRLTFSDDAAWRNKITGVYLNGNSIPIHSSRVNRSNAGMIEINLTGASLRPGTHEFLVKAEGYADATVSLVVAAPLAAPTLTGAAPNVDTVRFTFSDDAAWRNKITGVYLNGNSAPIHSSRVNRSNVGMIEINLTGASLRPGTHEFLVKAEGYADAVVSLVVAAPLAAPTLTGTAPNVDTVQFTFSDDAAWRNQITGVYLNGNSIPIHNSRVNRSTAGMVEINLTGASLRSGAHEFLIKAEGYADVRVVIMIEP